MILVGDIGGTHTRFALACRTGGIWEFDQLQQQPTVTDVESAIREYLLQAGNPAIDAVACCGAGPLGADGRIRLTNASVLLDPDALARAAGVTSAILVNDFGAVARAIPELPPDRLRPIGGGTPRTEAPRLVIGAGTGLGVAMVIPAQGAWIVVPGEGGHADLAPADEEQARAWTGLRAAHGRVSAETALSGPGLERLQAVLAHGRARPAPEIAEAAWRGEAEALQIVRLFTRWLGGFAGSLALTAGARGGVYLAGGIVPAWGERFEWRIFRRSFEDKPPFADWLKAVPSYVVTHPQPGLCGLAALAGDLIRGSTTSQP